MQIDFALMKIHELNVLCPQHRMVSGNALYNVQYFEVFFIGIGSKMIYDEKLLWVQGFY